MKKITELHFMYPAVVLIILLFFALPTQAQKDTTTVAKKEIFTYVEQMPIYPGGVDALMQFIGSNIKYSRSQPEGKVMVSFVVDKDGSVNDVQAFKGLDETLDQECVRVIKETSGKWKPGIQKGKPVAVRYIVPINFAQPKPKVEAQQNAAVYNETMPEFIGGNKALLKFISKNSKYPETATKHGLVKVEFIVHEDGSLTDFKINDSLEPVLDEEAIRVAKLTNGKWKPSTVNGKPVKVNFTLPIVFK